MTLYLPIQSIGSLVINLSDLLIRRHTGPDSFSFVLLDEVLVHDRITASSRRRGVHRQRVADRRIGAENRVSSSRAARINVIEYTIFCLTRGHA